MEQTNLYSSLEIPISIGSLRLFFFVNDRIYATGTGCFADPHDHGCYELQFVLRGKGKYTVEGEGFSLGAGDLILVRPGEWHYQLIEDLSPDIAIYRLRFSVKPPSEHASVKHKKSYARLIEVFNMIRIVRDPDLTLAKTFQNIALELKEGRSGYFCSLQSLCTLLLTDILRLSEIPCDEVFPAIEPKYSGYWRDRVECFLRLRYKENIKLQDLADSIQLSSRQASRLVMREFGVNYITKLNEIRLKQARFLLKHTDKSIHQISVECGFQNYTYFATCFRKTNGVTPNDFRRNLEATDDF